MLSRCIINVLLFINIVVARAPPDSTIILDKPARISVLSCTLALKSVAWEFTASKKTTPLCSYEPAFESLAYCVYSTLQERGYSNKTFEKTLKYVQTRCSYYDAHQDMSISEYHSTVNNASVFIQQYVKGATNVTYPVSPDKESVKQIYDAYHGYFLNCDIGNLFGGGFCAYFVGIMLLSGVLYLFSYTRFKKDLFRQRIVNYIRGHFILPAFFKKHATGFSHLKIFSGYVPTRLEGLTLTGYLLLHIIFLSCKYEYDPYNIIFKSQKVQQASFVADRTGVLAFAHFPLIVLFAGRNNFLEYVSGLKYTTFITFHKWLGRGMFIDALIHSAAYTSYSIMYKSYERRKNAIYWQFGVAATCIAAMMVFFSFAVFRKYFYEAFLFLHIVLGALFFYACWEHVSELSGIEWIYAAMAIWILDRVIRAIRLFYFGFPKAELQLIGDDLIKIRVAKPARYWKAKPGHYVFVSFLRPLYFWQSHPFTVMDSVVNEGELIIILKEKKGVTRLLKKFLQKSGGSASMRLAIEGPYGSSAPVHKYDNVLLLTGGTGLPGPIAHAIELGKTSAKSGKQFVNLVIVGRGFAVLEAYRSELLLLKDLNVQVDIYDTMKASSESESDSSKSQKDEKVQETTLSLRDAMDQTPSLVSGPINNDFEFAVFYNGRPNVNKILERSVNLDGSLAVLCCGPPTFVDDVRDQTAKMVVDNSKKAIEYFEEYQVW